MAFYIRDGNRIYQQELRKNMHTWAEITPTTTQLIISVFTTRKDAENYIKKYNLPGVISNNLDFEI